jgi:AraC-like DNA-binding protein
MLYKRIEPHAALSPFIECYWIIESDATADNAREKIIPDGFVEIIYHYGDSYKLSLHEGGWEEQQNKLLGGQIDQHFYIQNTGRTGMIGIKLRPEAATLLFGIDMSKYTNKVTSLTQIPTMKEVEMLFDAHDHDEILTKIEQYFLARIPQTAPHPIQKAVSRIFQQNGVLSVQDLSDHLSIGQRQLERLFKKYIGLSPKRYMRIIRFNYIFELMKNKGHNWQDLVFKAGYYDQSHFIKNFQEFTGEDPTQYGFNEKNMANFFLNKLEQ